MRRLALALVAWGLVVAPGWGRAAQPVANPGGDAPFLIDAGGLLPHKFRQRLEKFLKYHSHDAEIDLHVRVFAGDAVPEATARELAARLGPGSKPALLAGYFHGRPERVELGMSPELAPRVGSEQLERIRQRAVRAAEAESIAAEQLDEFCMQVAIDLCWLERRVGLVSSAPRPLLEEAPDAGGRGAGPSSAWAPWRAWMAEWQWPAGVLLGSVLLAVGVGWLVRARAVFEIPEPEVAPRLGATTGAGIGRLVSFRDSTEPPSRQIKGQSLSLDNL